MIKLMACALLSYMCQPAPSPQGCYGYVRFSINKKDKTRKKYLYIYICYISVKIKRDILGSTWLHTLKCGNEHTHT